MDYYNESDILKTFKYSDRLAFNDRFIEEKKKGALNYAGKVFVAVINSIPIYARMEDEHESGEQWVIQQLCNESSILESGRYDIDCAKVLWGFSAYLISNIVFELCDNEYYLNNINGVSDDIIFEQYYSICYQIYKVQKIVKYKYSNNDVAKIKALDEEFRQQHLKTERELWTKSQHHVANPLLKTDDFKKKVNDYFLFLARDMNIVKNEKPKFESIIQYRDKGRLLKRFHELIDNNSGAAIGSVFLKAKQECLITKKVTKSLFESEFWACSKSEWESIRKYTDEGNINALDRANQIVIFD